MELVQCVSLVVANVIFVAGGVFELVPCVSGLGAEVCGLCLCVFMWLGPVFVRS